MSDIKVPFLDLSEEFAGLQQEWMDAIADLGSKGAWIGGAAVDAFEAQAADYVGTQHAIGVANGTDALMLSLRAMGIGPGDEVITSPFTFFASSEAIDLVGATPVFADVQADTYNIDPESIAAKITDKTKAILPVHIFGNPADMDAINKLAAEHNLTVVEDACQAFGSDVDGRKVGSLGTTGGFSFYPTKVLGCYGDGGLITTDDSELDGKIRKLKNHGACAPFVHDEVGYNSRLDALQAQLLSIKLRKVDADISARRQVAAWYHDALKDTPLSLPAAGTGNPSWNLYTIRAPQRDELRAYLGDHNIPSSLCYPEGLHMQKVYAHLGGKAGDLPVVEQLCTESLALPVYPAMTQEQVMHVANQIKAFFS